jgi:hypothetical protein
MTSPRIWIRMSARAVIVRVLLLAIVSLTPMAFASPPDPTWLPGLYDDGDYDDVVLLITSGGGVADMCPLEDARPILDVVAALAPRHEPQASARIPARRSTRAPPRLSLPQSA